MQQKQSDPVIDEVREIRRRISAQFEHDRAKLVEHYRKLQEQFRDRLVGPPASRTDDPSAA